MQEATFLVFFIDAFVSLFLIFIFFVFGIVFANGIFRIFLFIFFIFGILGILSIFFIFGFILVGIFFIFVGGFVGSYIRRELPFLSMESFLALSSFLSRLKVIYCFFYHPSFIIWVLLSFWEASAEHYNTKNYMINISSTINISISSIITKINLSSYQEIFQLNIWHIHHHHLYFMSAPDLTPV